LFAKKEELLLYAKENKLAFVEDSSNASDKYTRNYFRHQLLPLLKSIYPNVEDNLLKSIHRFREVEILYNQALDLHKKKLVEAKGSEVHIPVLKLQKAIPRLTILYEILKDFGFSPNQTKEVEELLDSESGRYIASSSHRIIKNRKWLIVSPVSTVDAANILIEKSIAEVEFANGILHLKVIENNLSFQTPSAANIAALNAKEVTFPLLLRKWKQGDYFYPLGMRKKKKLSRFFIDKKLSKTEKENIWVIESNKKIIWIVGYRIDDRFKIEATTTEVLQISLDA
jgi:tRNA(Ile)-lysidine synthase